MISEEKDGNINQPTSWKQPKTNVTTSINHTSWKLAKDHNISWQHALEYGIQMLLAEGSYMDYPQNSRTYQKIVNLTKQLEQAHQGKSAEKEAEEILGKLNNETSNNKGKEGGGNSSTTE